MQFEFVGGRWPEGMPKIVNPEIQYHAEMYERRHAAVNVKVYSVFRKTRTLQPFFERIGMDDEAFDELVDTIMTGLQEMFWSEDVQEIGKECGFEKVYSEGRSSGWAAPYPYIHEEDFEEDTALLNHFLTFRERLDEIVDGLDAYLFSIMKDEFSDRENQFLWERSITIKAIRHFESIKYSLR